MVMISSYTANLTAALVSTSGYHYPSSVETLFDRGLHICMLGTLKSNFLAITGGTSGPSRWLTNSEAQLHTFSEYNELWVSLSEFFFEGGAAVLCSQCSGAKLTPCNPPPSALA